MKNCDEIKKNLNSACKGAKKFMNSNWDAKDKTMVVTIALLAGIIIGFLVSPVKNGMFSNNRIGCGNTAIGTDDEDDYYEDEE